MSKRRHNFGTKRFKEKSLFIFHARIALKSLILLFVRLIARGARIGKTHTHTHTHTQTDRQTDRQTKYCNPLAHARRGLTSTVTLAHARRGLIINVKCAGTNFCVGSIQLSFRMIVFIQYMQRCFQSKYYYISVKSCRGFAL